VTIFRVLKGTALQLGLPEKKTRRVGQKTALILSFIIEIYEKA
jgi:hypothetical protein